MALGSTQPLKEMSTRLFSGGKGGRCVELTILSQFCAVVMKSGKLNFLEPSGPLQACNGTALPLYIYIYIYIYIYWVSREECIIFRERVPYVNIYRYNPKHQYPKLNGYGDNSQRILKVLQLLHTY
jgi:hypothetical protein